MDAATSVHADWTELQRIRDMCSCVAAGIRGFRFAAKAMSHAMLVQLSERILAKNNGPLTSMHI
jgi:chemotaxis receptor (MCP) glutamine deamidase CheD